MIPLAHELEVHEDGTAAFVSAREKAWHGLGTVVDAPGLTATDGLRLAKLGDWNVRKVQLIAREVRHELTDDGVTEIISEVVVPDYFATVRDHPITGQLDALGVVGNVWTGFQNEHLTDLADAVVDEGGAHFQTMGSLQGGRKVFITMRLPKNILVGGTDAHELYLVLTNSHDGSASLQGMVSPVRVVCQNTLSWAMQGASNIWSYRHCNSITQVAIDARNSLRMSFRYAEKFEREAEKMINAQLTEAEFRGIAQDIIRPQAGDLTERQTSRDERILGEMTRLFVDAGTQQNIAGTRWAGFQAISEWKEYHSTVRKGDRTPEVARAERALAGNLSGFQADLFKAFAVTG